MSAAVAAILEGMPEPRDLRMHQHDGRCVITGGPVVLFDYAAGDAVMRNIALAVLRQLGFGGRAVAAALGLSEAYVATLHSAARRDGSAALAMQDRRGTPAKVTAAQWEQATAWRDQGTSDAEIGRRLGVANTTVGRGLGPRGQALAPGGAAGRAPADPLFSEPEQPAGADPEPEPDPEPDPEPEPGAGAGLPPGGGPAAWPLPAEGALWSRYAGAMLLHGFLAQAGAGTVLAAAAGEPGDTLLRSARPPPSSSSTWPPPRPGRWPGWRRCRACAPCGLPWHGSPTALTRWQLQPPRPDHPVADLSGKRIQRQPVLGGLINEYERAAWKPSSAPVAAFWNPAGFWHGTLAMRHISDTYVALFSHFIPCGVREAVYINERLLRNESDIQPDTIHADTQ